MRGVSSNRFWPSSQRQLGWLYWAMAAPALLAILKSLALLNIVMVFLALVGLSHVLRHCRSLVADPATRFFILLFLCLWVPQLLALHDAINLKHSLLFSGTHLRFLLVGLFFLYYVPRLGDDISLHRIVFLGFCVWVLDVCMQLLSGYDPFGYPGYVFDRPVGFYPQRALLPILAIFSPLFLVFLWQNHNRSSLLCLLGWMALVWVILFSGARSAWLMFFLACLGMALFFLVTTENGHRQKMLRVITLAGFVALAVGFATWYSSPTFQKRVSISLQLFSTDYDSVQLGSTQRLVSWVNALHLWKENPINGVGVRCFRYGEQKVAFSPNVHPHLHVLEVAAETGTLGLLGYLLFFGLLARRFLRLNTPDRKRSWPFLLCVLVALFPLNTGVGLHGSWTSSVYWLFITLFCLTLPVSEARRRAQI